MSKRQRQDLVKAFTAAKKYLSPVKRGLSGDGRRKYICFCLQDAVRSCEITLKQAEAAKCLIEARLVHNDRNWASLEGWLEHAHPELERDRDSDYDDAGRKIQATRLAWLDSLIEEFSK